ncbi:3-keto-disaccharide hydrolase [Flagellimonas eckloniae]|uniref:3-keto-alpha-glucoside-1,2-lyase/3-keto-2-hydroxy-glucal hydratase domain-containing protein n=1 Tax=Flagellimonas eckloniae TaxID=346185 RepID=A0A0Q1DJV2_9FLAO|nr:DUF1080 domain-containing protein [Allomuricauda eckloniae]KQC29090.1 hypothetical protein AAY42_03640 [Allomuricauda eckloniae]
MKNKTFLCLNILLLLNFHVDGQIETKAKGFDINKEAVWLNLFAQGELGTTYEINADHNDAQKLFEIKGNRTEVLYNWPDGEAPFGMISTMKEYSRFNLEFEYKWGNRKFAPRDSVKRDAGVLFHCKGPKKIWPSSLECQVQEGDTGDLWVIKGPKITVKNPNGTQREVDASGEKEYQRNVKFNDYEKEGWNHVRVEVRGAETARFFVNGHLVNEITDFISKDGSPLDSGYITFQAEGAELVYKEIRIQNLE